MKYDLRRKDFGIFAQAIAGVAIAAIVLLLTIGRFTALDIVGVTVALALILAVYPYTPLTGSVLFMDDHLVVTITQFKRDRVWRVPFASIENLREMKSNGGVTISWRDTGRLRSVVVWPERPEEFLREVESRRASPA